MDPFTIAAIVSGLGGAASSIFGGISESNNAAASNAATRQERNDAKLGQIDARGNRTRFVDGQGWVTTYGATDKRLEEYFLNNELPARQAQFQRSDIASRGENDQANALLEEFQRVQRGNPADIENLLFSQASRGVGENTQNALDTILRNQLRTGNTGANSAMESVQRSGNKALADASMDAKLKSLDYVDNKFATERGNTSNLYNMFANRAKSDLAPTTGATTPATTSANGSNMGLYQPTPDNGLANAIGGVSSAAAGSLNSLGAANQNSSTNALLNAFITGGGQFSTANGGIFDSIARRGRSGSGAF